jgi:hypothetical protein
MLWDVYEWHGWATLRKSPASLDAVGAWGAVRVVPVVRLIAVRFSGTGAGDYDDGTPWWSGPDAA